MFNSEFSIPTRERQVHPAVAVPRIGIGNSGIGALVRSLLSAEGDDLD